MESQRDRVLETLASPDFVQLGDKEALLAVRFYLHTPLTSKHLVVVYRELSEIDGFIITAYLTSQPASHREKLWTP
ncbi:MAG: hypothetical protein ACRDJH_03930 [Thermomicrobiales bacterium]